MRATSVTLASGLVVWRALSTDRAPGGCAAHGCRRLEDQGRRGLCHSHYQSIREAGGLDRIADAPKRASRPAHDGILYAMADSHGHIKIGFTQNLEQRLRYVRTHQAQPVEVVEAWLGTRQDETDAHRELSKHRTQGEWYIDCAPVRAFVAKACQGKALPKPPKRRRRFKVKIKPFTQPDDS